LHEIGVSGAIHSSMADHVGRWVDDKFVLAREYTLLSDIVPIYFGLWLYKLSGDEIKSICNRLQVSTKIEQSLRQIVKVRSIVSELDISTKPSDIVRKLDGLSDIALDVLALAVDKQDIRNNVERFRDEFRFIAPMTNGKELLELGLLPGPGLGRILLRLKEEWLDGTISNAEEENTLVKLLVAEEEKRE